MRKYLRGRKLSTRAAAARILRGEYVFLHHKPMHPGWMRSMQLHLIDYFCRRGSVRVAIKTTKATAGVKP